MRFPDRLLFSRRDLEKGGARRHGRRGKNQRMKRPLSVIESPEAELEVVDERLRLRYAVWRIVIPAHDHDGYFGEGRELRK